MGHQRDPAHNPGGDLLAEAFTRPKLMHRLAKLGFTQSYTYFTWRNSKRELTEYFTELAQGSGTQYFRPNVWPNTPDILQETLQSGLRPVFAARLILAATLAANYGIYGPLSSSWKAPRGSRQRGIPELRKVSGSPLASRPAGQPALADRPDEPRAPPEPRAAIGRSLKFCAVDNEHLIAYRKSDQASGNIVLAVVNLDPHHVQSGWIELDLQSSARSAAPYQVHDLLSEQRFEWRGAATSSCWIRAAAGARVRVAPPPAQRA